MLYETTAYHGDQMIGYSSVWPANDKTASAPDIPFMDLSNEEIQLLNPYDYMECDGMIAWRGVWYSLDEPVWPPNAYPPEWLDLVEVDLGHELPDEGWFEFEETWLPHPGEGSSVFFVDETTTLPFADLMDEDISSLYPGRDPLDYVDPYPEVYDMEYLE